MIRRLKRELSLLASIAFGLTASAAVTYKWTGGAGNLNWNDAANWSAESGSVDMAATAAWDFTGLPTGSTVTQQSGTINVAGITFAGTGSWTLAAASGAIVKFPDTGALSSITVPSGSSLDITFPLATGNTLGSQDIRFTGKGTIRVNPSTGSFASARTLRVTTDWTTLVIGPNWSNVSSSKFYLESTSSRIRLERDCEFGEVVNYGHGIIDVNGYKATFNKALTRWNSQNIVFAGNSGEAWFGSFQSVNLTQNAPTMDGAAIVAYNGYVNAGTLAWPSAVGLGIDNSGSISFGASQSVGAIFGDGVSGAIKLGDGASLTTTSAGEAKTYEARIAGGADFTKAGSYALRLNGAGSWSGKTTVAAGTLTLGARTGIRGLQGRYLFDDATAFGTDSSGSGWTATVTGDATAFSSVAGVTGKALAVDKDKTASLKLSGTHPDGTLVGNNPFTIELWVKPAVGIFNARQNSIVDLMNVGSTWDNVNMGWFYLAWSRQICFATGNMSISYDPGNVYPFSDGKWHHVATTYDGNLGQKLFLDGVCVKEQTMSHGYGFTSAAVNIGYRETVNRFGGEMDDIQIFNRCCSDEEIAAEFASRRPLASAIVPVVETKVPAPVAHYDFEDASAPGKDVSGNGYDLTAFGSWSVETCSSPSPAGRKAFVIAASDENGLKWTGEDYPAKMPTGNHAFSLAIRYVNNGSGEGMPVAAFGTMSQAYNFFEAGIGAWPRRHCANWWYNKGSTQQSWALTDTDNRDGSVAAEEGWTEMVYVYTTDQKVTAYRDGVLVATKTIADSAIYLGQTDLSIGWRSDLKDKSFKGAIDDVRIYDCALTAEQVKLVARDQAGLSLAPAIPAASPVTVAAGATLAAEGDVTLNDLALAGTVTAPVRTLVALTGTANVSGQVTGGCSVTVPSGSTVALAAGRVPFADVGQLMLPESLAFTVDALPSDDGAWKTYVIATATDFVLPADFDGWTVTGLDTAKYRYGFAAENGTLTLSAKRKQGMLLILR